MYRTKWNKAVADMEVDKESQEESTPDPNKKESPEPKKAQNSTTLPAMDKTKNP